jgi:hypothetical protein
MKGQSKRHSFLEALLGTAIGFWVAVGSQYLIFPIFGIYTEFRVHVYLGLFFTVVSIIRGYFVRRLFNWLHIKGVLS